MPTAAASTDLTPLLVSKGGTADYESTSVEQDSDGASSSEEGEHLTTVRQTFLHLLKGYIGCGCLSLPWAVSQLGIPFGCLSIAIMAYWSSYNCWTVVKLKRYIERTSDEDGGDEEDDDDGAASDGAPSLRSSITSAASSVTYADVGGWAHGQRFNQYITACVVTQQLAICTVFLSFIGENLLAVLLRLDVTNPFLSTHASVLTMALPAALALSFLPNLKSMAPAMAAGTVTLAVAFATLGVVVGKEWDDRPESPPGMNAPQVPLALCAILYSYEGINLILPVESAMKEPRHFGAVFWAAMSCVALILAVLSTVCVLAFGNVTSGSVTAFLLEAYGDDDSVTWWLMLSNTAVSLSVLFTYPLQLFPALELVAPWFQQRRTLRKDIDDLPQTEDDLEGFEPLPPLPEHDEASVGSLPSYHHDYGTDDRNAEDDSDNDDDDDSSRGAMSSVTGMLLPQMTIPGDSPRLRTFLVLVTYAIAAVVPNVQSLISLAGAVAGSSTALLIPPILELAWIRHLEKEDPSKAGVDAIDESRWCIFPGSDKSSNSRWRYEKAKCYLLLFLGSIFTLVGTYASISDIVSIYSSS